MSINQTSLMTPVMPSPTRPAPTVPPTIPNAAQNPISMPPALGADTLSLSKPAPKPELRFAGWGTLLKILPFVEVGLKYGNDRLEQSMQRDEQRRKARERYEKIGRSYREYDRRGHHYRTVTKITVVDGNGKVLDRKERVGRWHRAR